jgi:hypothetical protein
LVKDKLGERGTNRDRFLLTDLCQDSLEKLGKAKILRYTIDATAPKAIRLTNSPFGMGIVIVALLIYRLRPRLSVRKRGKP